MRLATYNCRNYFVSDSAVFQKSIRERDAVAQTIQRLDADLLFLQEIESMSALEEINQRLATPYQYLLLEPGNSERGIHLATMSRLPFEGQSYKTTLLLNHDENPFQEYPSIKAFELTKVDSAKFQRDLFLTEFNIEGQSLLVFNTHLKSRKNYSWQNHSADTIRKAESDAIRRIITEFVNNSKLMIAVVGDFNQRFQHSSIIELTKMKGLNDPVHRDVVSISKKATTYHTKTKERIDYILLSDSLNVFYQTDSARIHDNETARIASDHLPVSVDFNFDKPGR